MLLFATGALITGAVATETKVAVASNFTETAKELAASFASTTEHRAVLSFGATGQLYAQISQGAPFEVFLAADQATPRKAVSAGVAVPETQFSYAIGRLVLFSPDAQLVRGEATLKAGKFNRIALANPATAPFGAAAVETLRKLGDYDSVAARIVQGNNVSQTLSFIDTGNAELGFVALSQVMGRSSGSRWLVPKELHAPLVQDAVLLSPGAESAAARAFMAFLRGPQARAIINRHGYDLPD